MAEARISVHVRYVPDFGPVSRFVPSTLQIQENADAGGGKPAEPKALVFTDPASGETDVYVMSEQTRQQLLRMLTGGVIVAGAGDIIGGDAPGGGT